MTNNAPTMPQNIGPPPEYRATKLEEAGSAQFDMAAALPSTSVSVMVVIDADGYLMPLCTAGDLLRWCKAAWRAAEL
jgi:hypothetical protein